MHTRPSTRRDLPAIVNISYHAFLHDELNAYRWPHRFEKPDAYKADLAQRARNADLAPGVLSVVVVADAADATSHPSKPAPKEGEVLGLAAFARVPDGPAFDASKIPRSATLSAEEAQAQAQRDLSRNTDVWTSIDRFLCGLEARYTALTGQIGAAADPVHQTEVSALFAANTMFSHLPSHWMLNFLCVNPDFEGRGVGTMLVRYGKKLARESGTPLTLVSAAGRAQGMYTKKEGFKIVGYDGPLKDLGELKGGAECVWDPWGLWVKEIEERATTIKGARGRNIDGEWIM